MRISDFFHYIGRNDTMIPNMLIYYCCEDISLVENYEKAVADTTQTWHCHHRLEDNGYTEQQLKDLKLYYGRPASELILLTPFEHLSLHHKGKPKSEEHRRKIGESQRGKVIPNETKYKLSKAQRERFKGRVGTMFGKSHTEATKTKISKSKIGQGKGVPKSEEHRKKIGKANIGKYNNKYISKTVYMYDKNHNYIRKFPSSKEAERQLGFDSSSITKCCRGVRSYKTVHGYIFSYEQPKLRSIADISHLF